MTEFPARALLALIRRLPQASLSRLLGRIARVRVPRSVRAPVLRLFARSVGADVAEAELPLVEYESVAAFFVRRLRPDVRSWPTDATLAGCPVDGVLGAHGLAQNGALLQAKGLTYSVEQLLDDQRAAAPFTHGPFLTVYLSPRHYHRIHAPIDARLTSARHIPGSLLPVHRTAVEHVEGLFVRNERVIVHMESDAVGRLALVAIGAYNVGAISTEFDTGWGNGAPVSNRRDPVPSVRTYAPPLNVTRADELMAFQLGSTVVLLFEAGRASLSGVLRLGAELRVGRVITQPVRHHPIRQ